MTVYPDLGGYRHIQITRVHDAIFLLHFGELPPPRIHRATKNRRHDFKSPEVLLNSLTMADPILETPPQPTALLSLPDELLRAIFEHVSAPDLAHLQLTCRRFTLIGADPLLWQSECLDSFRWWDKDHDLERKRRDVTYSGWKELFAMRWVSKRKGRTALDRVMREDKGRLLRVKEVLDLGYDAKDFLMESWRGARGSEMFLAQRWVWI